MTYDVAIIGAGLNGLTCALALGSDRLRRPLRVALIDAKALEGPITDSRGTALTQATLAMFGTLGVRDLIEAEAQEMRHIIVTDGAKPIPERASLLAFDAGDGEAASAVIIENGLLIGALRAAVASQSDIVQHYGAAVESLTFGPGPARITLANGTAISAALVVGADGRHSRMREFGNIAVDHKDYGQSALTFTIAHEHPHGGRAEEHFTAHGVLAVLPLTGQRSSIVWVDTTEHGAALMGLSEPDFVAAFSDVLGSHLGTLTLASKRNCYPLSLMTAKEMIAPRLALIGDAAHVIHPLAGLGLNLGFKDAAALADCLADAVAIGEDIGNIAVLERYQQMRRFDTLSTTLAIDGMNSLFANANPLLSAMRGAGLALVNRLPVAKDFFMSYAAGNMQTPPRLMRGLLP